MTPITSATCPICHVDNGHRAECAKNDLTACELRAYAETQLEEFLRSLPDGETNYLVSSAAMALAQARLKDDR